MQELAGCSAATRPVPLGTGLVAVLELFFVVWGTAPKAVL